MIAIIKVIGMIDALLLGVILLIVFAFVLVEIIKVIIGRWT